MTYDEIVSLTAGDEADREVCRIVGHRINKPTSNIVSAFQLENMVAAASQERAYIGKLQEVTANNPGGPKWRIVHASALERCQAYLLMMEYP